MTDQHHDELMDIEAKLDKLAAAPDFDAGQYRVFLAPEWIERLHVKAGDTITLRAGVFEIAEGKRTAVVKRRVG